MKAHLNHSMRCLAIRGEGTYTMLYWLLCIWGPACKPVPLCNGFTTFTTIKYRLALSSRRTRHNNNEPSVSSDCSAAQFHCCCQLFRLHLAWKFGLNQHLHAIIAELTSKPASCSRYVLVTMFAERTSSTYMIRTSALRHAVWCHAC